jgi:hypothetical protein
LAAPISLRLQRRNCYRGNLLWILRNDSEKHDSTRRRQALPERHLSKIFVECKKNQIRTKAERDHFIIGCASVSLTDSGDIETCQPQRFNCRPREVLIRQEPHAG